MLVLTRKENEEIRIANTIRVRVIKIIGSRVQLGIVAPESVAIRRAETQEAEMPPASGTLPVVSEKLNAQTDSTGPKLVKSFP